jgi:Glycosyl transferase family 2
MADAIESARRPFAARCPAAALIGGTIPPPPDIEPARHKQDWPNKEIIVVDDASTDDSEALL